MTQKEAEKLGYELLKGAPLSEQSRGYIEASLPYIIQKYYLAGYEVAPKFKPGLTAGDLERMKDEGVAY